MSTTTRDEYHKSYVDFPEDCDVYEPAVIFDVPWTRDISDVIPTDVKALGLYLDCPTLR